ncbi:MAG: class I SAM-dependent methyltransferase [Bdellovibrionales bacterium]|nr:class I SAM-dependent methyltransferase [Ramlibacter sp.]
MFPQVTWTEADEPQAARWRSEAGVTPPKRIITADDTLNADTAYRLACEGTAFLWRGDFQNARQLVQALARRVDRKPVKPAKPRKRAGSAERAQDAKIATPVSPAEAFHLHRQAQAQRARVLASVLIPLDADYSVPLRRAPDLKLACTEAWGPPDAANCAAGSERNLVSLRELLGLVGAHEWRKKGVAIAALGDGTQADGPQGNRIHPHYGVFSPVRGEYVGLVARAPLPRSLAGQSMAFDIGTGTGVLAAVLARRGIARVLATEQDPRALACARDNMTRLELNGQVQVLDANLFPPGRAPLIVCNPPWLPGRASSPIERAVYDEGSGMLRGFLAGLAAHLAPGGEGWLILSDFAEHLGLRTRAELLALIDAAGLKVRDRIDVKPHHPKAADASDPLHAARALEVTSLWRLVPL